MKAVGFELSEASRYGVGKSGEIKVLLAKNFGKNDT
jgi:hypothetical protein